MKKRGKSSMSISPSYMAKCLVVRLVMLVMDSDRAFMCLHWLSFAGNQVSQHGLGHQLGWDEIRHCLLWQPGCIGFIPMPQHLFTFHIARCVRVHRLPHDSVLEESLGCKSLVGKFASAIGPGTALVRNREPFTFAFAGRTANKAGL